MYAGYLFAVAFAILVTSTASEDSVFANLDGNKIFMSTDEVCRNAGFVHKDDLKVKSTVIGNHGSLTGDKPAPKSMTTTDIILTVLGVAAGLLILAFLGNYCYKKHKVN